MDEIARLRALTEGIAFLVPDIPAELASGIRRAANGGADPWLLTGLLVEGVAHVIRTAIPPERQQDCAFAAMRLLVQRTALIGR